MLDAALRQRHLTAAVGVGVMIVTVGLVLSGRPGFRFVPALETDVISAPMTMPQGSPVETTGEAVARLGGAYGEEAQRIQRGRDDIRVMVRYPRDERRSLGDPESMRIRTPAGGQVLHRKDFALAPAPAGACILYALSCNVSDADLAGRLDLLAGGGRAASPDDDEDNGDEGEGRRAATCASRRGAVAAPATSASRRSTAGRHPRSTACTSLMQLWKSGEQSRVDGYLDARGLWRHEVFARVVQAVTDLAERGTAERTMLESIQSMQTHVRTHGGAAVPRPCASTTTVRRSGSRLRGGRGGRQGSGIRSASTSVCAWFREGQRRYETHQGERLVLRQESWRSSPVQAPDQVGQGDGEGTARRRNQRCAARKHLASSGPTEVGGLAP